MRSGKLLAFIKRDFLSEVSYRLAFPDASRGQFLSLLAFLFMTKMMDPRRPGSTGSRR